MNREKVTKGLEHCKIGDCVGCPYDQIREESLHGKHDKWQLVCNEQLTEDILSLLREEELPKERETVEPLFVENPYTHLLVSYCPKCREPISKFITGNPYKETRYCHYCGQEVKWE